MVNPLEITYYMNTGFSPSDEPDGDAVIEQNISITDRLQLVEYDPSNIRSIKVVLTDVELHQIDFLKIRDTVTNERWYYYVLRHQRINEKVVMLEILIDAFATVGLTNISFFGNIIRRSLSVSERQNYPLLPEPWAPRRPLKVRRMVIDLNVNKSIRIPSHITTTFEEETTGINQTAQIDVPQTPFGLSTKADTLTVSASLPMGYPNAATDTNHTITTPWGNLTYTTPYEQYYNLTGASLNTFLAKAKKYNALDLIEPPYYLPSPEGNQQIILNELINSAIKHSKASRYYTTITIRSLASNASRTYSDSDTNLQYNQSLTVVVVPDKNGGIYVIPTTIRDTGLSAYTYLDGVYSPFETVTYNAVGDTPAKFAADGTNLLNTALNTLFESYIRKTNALQYENMQAKYFKDIGSTKAIVMNFAAEALGLVTETVTTTDPWQQITDITTSIPDIIQQSTQTQTIPRHTQTQTGSNRSSGYKAETIGINKIPEVRSRSETITDPLSNDSDTSSRTDAYQTTSTSTTTTPETTSTNTGSVVIPEQKLSSTSTSTTNKYSQQSRQITNMPGQSTRSVTTQGDTKRTVEQGVNIAKDGANYVFELEGNPWNTLQTIILGSYRNEVHSFMLGNINDYLNRWVSIQNDMHNGKVANLFKNITLLGNYTDYNKVAGKYEIVISSLQPEDEMNFNLFLEHFGYAVDEYSDQLISETDDNYNYVMIGDDALLFNTVQQDLSARIINQLRTGVRVWKTLIRPSNY